MIKIIEMALLAKDILELSFFVQENLYIVIVCVGICWFLHNVSSNYN